MVIAGCSGYCTKTPLQDLDRWSSNIQIVLNSPRAKKRFCNFLSSQSLEDAEVTLKFWDRCNQILLEASKNDLMKSQVINMNSVLHARFRKDYEKLVEYAEEFINFDAHQLRVFRKPLNEGHIPKMLKTIKEAQASSAVLLQDEYSLFRKELVNEIKSIRCAKKK